jgi:hypothetical protein
LQTKAESTKNNQKGDTVLKSHMMRKLIYKRKNINVPLLASTIRNVAHEREGADDIKNNTYGNIPKNDIKI